MAITYERSYKASDGKCYGTLDEAQEVEIRLALISGTAMGIDDAASSAAAIIKAKDAILAILTLTDTSRPKARGVKKVRKAKQQELPKVQAA